MQPGPHLRFSGRQHEDQVSADVCRDAGQVEDVDRHVKDDQVVHRGHVSSGCSCLTSKVISYSLNLNRYENWIYKKSSLNYSSFCLVGLVLQIASFCIMNHRCTVVFKFF